MKFYLKKTAILFAFIAALSFNSCSSDDDENLSTSGDIVGVWTGVDVDYTSETETSIQGQTLSVLGVGEAYDVNYTLTFAENPNELTSSGSYSIELTSTVLGQSTVQNIENLQFLETSIWSKSGNEITIETNGIEQIMTIVELTATSLTLSSSATDVQTQSGATYTSTVDIITTYTR